MERTQSERKKDIPQDQGGKDGRDHQGTESIDHNPPLVSLHYKGIPHIAEEYHGIYQTAR